MEDARVHLEALQVQIQGDQFDRVLQTSVAGATAIYMNLRNNQISKLKQKAKVTWLTEGVLGFFIIKFLRGRRRRRIYGSYWMILGLGLLIRVFWLTILFSFTLLCLGLLLLLLDWISLLWILLTRLLQL